MVQGLEKTENFKDLVGVGSGFWIAFFFSFVTMKTTVLRTLKVKVK